MRADLLIIGSGIAGLFTALKTSWENPEIDILVVTKADDKESNTKYAQGGIAVVLDEVEDSTEKHIADTLKAGDGLCVEEVVRIVVEEGILRFNELLETGANFEKTAAGTFELGREGGHTANRVAHHKDMTGLEIETALLNAIHSNPKIQILTHHYVIDLITDHHVVKRGIKLGEQNTCHGAYILDIKKNKIHTLPAKAVVLASGGIGHVYKNTTNPSIATGDGIGLAYRAKAYLEGMEFIQFHPTALYEEKEGMRFLITEAVRGKGAKLKTQSGDYFMSRYDERGELASRDIVARAIDSELKITGDDFVLLDCSSIKEEEFEKLFPNILSKCRNNRINPFEEGIPVVPAAHYLCGGIKVDSDGWTNIDGFLSAGECSYTGLHGANRLASNSLLEALVFAHRCAKTSIELISRREELPIIPDWEDEGLSIPGEHILIKHFRKEVQSVMSDFVGIVRTGKRLRLAEKSLKLLYEEINELYRISKLSLELGELRNLVSVAYLVVQQSKRRKENKGVYFNRDIK